MRCLCRMTENWSVMMSLPGLRKESKVSRGAATSRSMAIARQQTGTSIMQLNMVLCSKTSISSQELDRSTTTIARWQPTWEQCFRLNISRMLRSLQSESTQTTSFCFRLISQAFCPSYQSWHQNKQYFTSCQATQPRWQIPRNRNPYSAHALVSHLYHWIQQHMPSCSIRR